MIRIFILVIILFLISSCYEKCYHDCSISHNNCQDNCMKKYENNEETLIRCSAMCTDFFAFCCSECRSND
jgi:hypothetical protein